MWYQMKAKGITIPKSTQYIHLTFLRFSQKQKMYQNAKKKAFFFFTESFNK